MCVSVSVAQGSGRGFPWASVTRRKRLRQSQEGALSYYFSYTKGGGVGVRPTGASESVAPVSLTTFPYTGATDTLRRLDLGVSGSATQSRLATQSSPLDSRVWPPAVNGLRTHDWPDQRKLQSSSNRPTLFIGLSLGARHRLRDGRGGGVRRSPLFVGPFSLSLHLPLNIGFKLYQGNPDEFSGREGRGVDADAPARLGRGEWGGPPVLVEGPRRRSRRQRLGSVWSGGGRGRPDPKRLHTSVIDGQH